jgi:hypothetical protein
MPISPLLAHLAPSSVAPAAFGARPARRRFVGKSEFASPSSAIFLCFGLFISCKVGVVRVKLEKWFAS